METSTVLTLVSVGLGLIATVAGVFWGKARGKLKQVVNLFKQVYELVDAVFKMIDDNTITQEELDTLKKEAADVKDAFKALLGKTI